MFKFVAFYEGRKIVNTFEHDFHISGNSGAEKVSTHLNMSSHLMSTHLNIFRERNGVEQEQLRYKPNQTSIFCAATTVNVHI